MEKFNNTHKAIIGKLELMQGYFSEIEPLLVPSEKEILTDSKSVHAIERLFQLIVDAAIDINTAIIVGENLQISEDYQGTFAIVARSGAISHDLANMIAPSVGLRNGLVHAYEKLDTAKVIHDVRKNVGQYKEFIAQVLKYIEQRQNTA